MFKYIKLLNVAWFWMLFIIDFQLDGLSTDYDFDSPLMCNLQNFKSRRDLEKVHSYLSISYILALRIPFYYSIIKIALYT
ncbi:hypothetical protein FACS1894113_0230 [Alphaproteobacteria bacterium]|nr:hypothetical protein FACS1894113_0230 [Alphaproteobacteria bacterium]